MSAKNIKDQLVEAAMELAQEQEWAAVSLADIARRCGLSESEVYNYAEDKEDILILISRMIDRHVAENTQEFNGEDESFVSQRDRLFDVLMERFDILNEYRPALLSILKSLRADPKKAALSAPHLCRSMNRMLELAGIPADGLRGAAKAAALTAIYLKTLKVWKDDDSPDMSQTMAALDKDLGHAERLAGLFRL
ncbi:MAG: TetR family transcriptional regulator [Alphaproteobacteria bacterium]|nr:TetR family transcriptional regulator [Alphaproteobacteria bacterium]MCB1721313.1 TetR family transcriptional regulator [Alphaproteobacteria bacterium]